MKKALEGVRVLDFTQVLAGPFCTMNLADFGAEVIKIEKPGVGDGSRIFGPFKNGQSGYYTLVNRGKKGIAIDLKKGKDLIYDMVKSCDIVVENFKPGVMKKLGFSYEDLKQINPKIIYCSISGFGQDSPMRDLPAYDIVAQGMSGMMSITGYPDTPPARVGASLGDVSAGLYAVTGILLALYNRERTGEGQYVDVALLDSVFAFVETNVVRHTIGGIHPTRVGARHPLSAPFDIYMCKDTYVIITLASDHHFAKLCEMIGQPDLIKDPKFDSDPHRSQRCGAQGHPGEVLQQLHRRRGDEDDAGQLHPLRPSVHRGRGLREPQHPGPEDAGGDRPARHGQGEDHRQPHEAVRDPRRPLPPRPGRGPGQRDRAPRHLWLQRRADRQVERGEGPVIHFVRN